MKSWKEDNLLKTFEEAFSFKDIFKNNRRDEEGKLYVSNESLRKIIKSKEEKYREDSGVIDLNNINTSKVTDMQYLFSDCKGTYDVSSWDTSNVVSMKKMFSWTKAPIGVENWDMSNVRDISYMFQKNEDFNGNLDNWDLSSVETIDKCFWYCPLENNPPSWFEAVEERLYDRDREEFLNNQRRGRMYTSDYYTSSEDTGNSYKNNTAHKASKNLLVTSMMHHKNN